MKSNRNIGFVLCTLSLMFCTAAFAGLRFTNNCSRGGRVRKLGAKCCERCARGGEVQTKRVEGPVISPRSSCNCTTAIQPCPLSTTGRMPPPKIRLKIGGGERLC